MNKEQARRLRIRAVRRNPPDLTKLSRALIELAQAQAEPTPRARCPAAQGRERPTPTPDADPPEAA